MGRIWTKFWSRAVACVVVAAIVLGGHHPVVADAPASAVIALCRAESMRPEPGWLHPGSACRSSGRSLDQATHPGFFATGATNLAGSWPGPPTGDEHAPTHHVPGTYIGDPYRLPWNWEEAGRGIRVHTRFPNRRGAELDVSLWFPPGSPPSRGHLGPPLPTVVIVPGARGFQDALRWAAQGLAESGYLAVTVDPQDTGRSESCGTPTPESSCPGRPGARDYGEVGSATHVAALEDTLDWLLRSPFARSVDEDRIGLAGHSLGAFAALLVGNRDLRVDAVVAWDLTATLGSPHVAPVVPTTPTMFQHSETGDLCPTRTACPGDPDDHPAVRNASAFSTVGVPVHSTVLADSTHHEWAYQIAPPGLLSASSKGERVAMHYTLAWFDYWLGRGHQAATPRRGGDALARLVASRFDGSADRSAIGTGRWDPIARRNVPHRIEGDFVVDHLSPVYPSMYDLGFSRCDNLRAGCHP